MAILFTGYPGFLGTELLPRVLSRSTGRAMCVVQRQFMPLAQARLAQLSQQAPDVAARVDLVEGDITRPGLGVAGTLPEISEIYHLAAIYDLSVRRDVAMRVNVEGTRHVLDLAEDQASLQRLHYVSTCYVSGRFDGVFTESDLLHSAHFNNFYEETKYLAEVEVRSRMSSGLPATIYRPAVVVGDSATGETQKYDGPYFVIRWILRQPRIALLPVVGSPRKYRFNVVPRDFIVSAIDALSAMAASAGKTYQLADPDPMTVDEIIRAIAEATGRTIVRIPLTLGIARAAIDHVPGIYRLLRIPSAAANYFVHPTSYDTTNAATDLRQAGIRVPRFREYLPRLVEFVRAHPAISSAAMA